MQDQTQEPIEDRFYRSNQLQLCLERDRIIREYPSHEDLVASLHLDEEEPLGL